MITCRLVTITHSPEGSRTEAVCVSGETLEIGRGAACPIHLPAPDVDPLHATIRRLPDGSLQIEAPRGGLIKVNGFMESAARLTPGTEIRIGSYLLAVERSEGEVDLVLSVQTPAAGSEAPAGTLAAPAVTDGPRVSKRALGLGLAALILLLFLVLPTLPRLSTDLDAWQADLPVTFTQSLNPGPLSRGHRLFEGRCSTCHDRAFRGVADAACTQCHEQVGGHLAADSRAAHRLEGVRCADCHPAHAAKRETLMKGASVCLSCHRNGEVADARAADFGHDHPPFGLSVPLGDGAIRVTLDSGGSPSEQSGLRFSHKVHLMKEGVSTPSGDTVLTCPDCHVLERSGDHFAPMEMERSCQQSGCHRIRLPSPSRPLVRHGPVEEVMNTLRLDYAQWLGGGPAARLRRCAPLAETDNPVRQTLDCIHRLADENAGSSLFRTTGKNLECALCHEITATGTPDSPWSIAPVRTRHDWQPKALFRHSKHGTLACVECHDKSGSEKSEDVAFPQIEKCRECHAGAEAAGKIGSRCQDCHTFHRIAGPGAGLAPTTASRPEFSARSSP